MRRIGSMPEPVVKKNTPYTDALYEVALRRLKNVVIKTCPSCGGRGKCISPSGWLDCMVCDGKRVIIEHPEHKWLGDEYDG